MKVTLEGHVILVVTIGYIEPKIQRLLIHNSYTYTNTKTSTYFQFLFSFSPKLISKVNFTPLTSLHSTLKQTAGNCPRYEYRNGS